MHIYASDLKYLRVAIPPIIEQAAIARFLDHANSRIDRYVRAKEELFGAAQRQPSGAKGLIGEYRERLISDVVTGKLDVRGVAARLSDQDDSNALDCGQSLVEAANDRRDRGDETCPPEEEIQ